MVQYLILLTETAAFLGLNISFLFTVRASANPYSPDEVLRSSCSMVNKQIDAICLRGAMPGGLITNPQY